MFHPGAGAWCGHGLSSGHPGVAHTRATISAAAQRRATCRWRACGASRSSLPHPARGTYGSCGRNGRSRPSSPTRSTLRPCPMSSTGGAVRVRCVPSLPLAPLADAGELLRYLAANDPLLTRRAVLGYAGERVSCVGGVINPVLVLPRLRAGSLRAREVLRRHRVPSADGVPLLVGALGQRALTGHRAPARTANAPGMSGESRGRRLRCVVGDTAPTMTEGSVRAGHGQTDAPTWTSRG